MTTNQNLSLDNNQFNNKEKDEIDLKKIFNTLIRNKKIIGVFTLTGIIISGFIAFTTKKTWQGEFQIVLETSQPSSALSNSNNLRTLAFLGGKGFVNQLETEIGILKSPLVLMKVFEFVKLQKNQPNNDSSNYHEFKSWRDDLSISLENGTNILSLTYKDQNKDIILPVLNRISSTYQEYSGMKRLRGIELGVDYFTEQIAIYKNKSIASSREAQQFAIDQNLSVLSNESGNDIDIKNALNVSSIRLKAANDIRLIDQQLEQIDQMGNDYEEIIYTSSTIQALDDLTDKLKKIDTSLYSYRLIYQENDKEIQNLLKARIQTIELLKKQTKGFLLAKREDAEVRMKAAERPSGVIIKYRELLREASKNQATLDNLENEYRSLLLEKARSEDPWKLITKPQLLPYPIAPRKKKIVGGGLLAGLFLGCGAALIANKRKNIIFSIDEMELSTNSPLLAELPLTQKQKWNEALNLIESGILSDKEGSLALLVAGDLGQSILTQLEKSVLAIMNNRNIKITNNLIEATKCSNLIVVTAIGITSINLFNDINKKLLLQKKPVLGLIAIT